MPNDKLEPGQLKEVTQSVYNPKNQGGVIDNTGRVEPPSSTNLLLDTPVSKGGTPTPGASALAAYQNILKNSPVNALGRAHYSNLAPTERYSNDEFGGYNPHDINQEDWYGKEQGWFTQMGNRLGKFGVKTVGSFANALMDIPNMVNAISQGNLDKMWDNPVNTWASDMMEWSEKVMPNYKTNWEAEHPFLNLVPFYGNAGNGWGNVLEQTGFTVGAIGGAIVEDLAVGALTGGVGEIPLAAMQLNKMVYNLGKLIGKGDDAMAALKASIKSSDDIVKGLKGIDRFNWAVREGLWGANMVTSGFSEAAFEGIESYKTLSKDLQKQFRDENGRMPTFEESQRIETYSRDAANSRFLLNSALLAATNTIQWGSLMRPFNVTKDVLESEVKQGVKVALKEGSKDVFEIVEPTSKLIKFGNKVKNSTVGSTLIGSSSEGFEEGAQYTVQTGVEDYYKRKYNNEAIGATNNFMKSFTHGLSEALGTQQGWENIVYGLLGGAMFKTGENIYKRANGQPITPDYKKHLDAVVQGLNAQSLTGIFENKYGEAVAATAIEKDLQTAAKNGDLYQYKNFKHEQFANFILSGLQQNKFDTRISQLRDLKNLKEDEFQKMFGVPASVENKRNVESLVNKMESNARYMKDVHERVSRTFINPFEFKGTGNYKNKEQAEAQQRNNINHLAYEDAKQQLTYTMSVAKDSQDRIAQLRGNIATADTRVSPDTFIKLASEDGLKTIRKEYKERVKTLEDGLKLAKDAGTQKELDWTNKRIQELEVLLEGTGDRDSKLKTYNGLLKEVISNEAQQGSDTKVPYDALKAGELLNTAKDIALLQKRNEAAIDHYARLTTKGGFKRLFSEVLDARKEAAAQAVNLDPEQPKTQAEKTVAEQQAEALGMLANNPDELPQTQPAKNVPNNGMVNTQEITKKEEPTADERKRFNKIVVNVVDGKYLASELELGHLGFKTIADLDFEIGEGKYDLKDFTKVKSTGGMDYYIHNDVVKAARVIASQGEDVTEYSTNLTEGGHAPQNVDPNNPPAQNPPAGNNPSGATAPNMFVENFLAKIFVPADLRPAFNAAIFSGTPQEIKQDISISVQALPPQYQKEYDEQKRTASYTPFTGFPGVFIAKAPIDLSIAFKGQEIGKVAFPERLLFKVGNNFVTVDKLTPQQYYNFTKNPATTHAAAVADFNRMKAFKNYLAIRYKENNNQPVTLTPQELNELFDMEVTYGELDLVRADKDRPTFASLTRNKVKFTDAQGNTQETMAIVSVPKRYSADIGTRARTEFMVPIYGQNFYDSGVMNTPLDNVIATNPGALLALGSRYVGAIQLPNGQYTFVALRPAEMADDVKETMFTDIKNRATESITTNMVEVATREEAQGTILVGDRELHYRLKNDEAKAFNDEFNNNLNDKVFITDVNGKMWFNISISPIGAVRFEVYEPVSGYNTVVYVSPQKVQSLNNFGELVGAIQQAVAKKAANDPDFAKLKVNVATTNFRQNLPKDAQITADQASTMLTASVTVNVTKNGSMKLIPNSTAVTAAYQKVDAATRASVAPEAQATAEPTAEAAPATDVVQETITPAATQPQGMFGGLQQGDDTGQPIEITPADATTPEAQEDLSEQVFSSAKDALASKDIRFASDPMAGVVYYEISSGNKIATLSGVPPIELIKQMKLKVVLPKKEETEDDDPFKLVDENIDVQRTINIEKARAYIESILPSFISVDDVNTILDRVSVNGQIFGAFSKGVIYLNEAAEAGTEYHEAFHAVFRTLLTEAQINDYLKAGQEELYKKLKKEGKSIRSLLAERRALGLYANLSDKDAYDRLYEEHMADRFQTWKTKKEEGGLLDKLFDLIRRFFKWFKRSGNDLEMLFRNIDNGTYRYSNIAANRFTTEMNDEFSTPEFAFSLIPARPGSVKVGTANIAVKRNLDAKTSKQIVQTVAAYFNINRKQTSAKNFTDEQLLDKVLDDLRNTYHVDNPLYAGWTQEQKNILLASDQAYIYSNEESREAIKDGAKKYLNTIKFIEQFEDLASISEQEPEQELGNDQPSTGFDNTAENNGGFSSLPALLREYIGFTTYDVPMDEFGNTTLSNGMPIIATVDSLSVYYGLLRSLANITDPVRFFQRMVKYGQSGNAQTGHFVSKFIADTGLDTNILFNENRIVATGNRALAEMVKKGFNKYRVDYVFTEYDITKNQAKSYHPNRRNVENIQFSTWSNNFVRGYADMSVDSQKATRQSLNDILNKYFDPRRNIKYTSEQLDLTANEIRNALTNVGIVLSLDYIKYSLLLGNVKKYDEQAEAYKKQGVELTFEDPANRFITKEDYQYVQIMKIPDEHTIGREFFEQIVAGLTGGTNPYFKEIRSGQRMNPDTNQLESYEDEIDTAMIGRLLDIARGNAIFDESVGESSYMNAAGKLVYAHQDGTFNVKASFQLRDAEYRKKLRETGIREDITSYKDEYDAEWLTMNPLLNSQQFEAIADTLLFQRIDGIRAVETNSLGKVITQEFRDQKEGVTYGDYSPREFIVNLMNMYVSYSRKQRTSTGEVVTAPHLIRVLEASKTADTVNLPINLDIYTSGSVTSKTVDRMLAEVQKEFRRINRVKGEIGTLTHGVVENYHTGSFAEDGVTVAKGYRGLQFTDNITQLIGKQLATTLERKARGIDTNEVSLEDIAMLKNAITESLNKLVDGSLDIMVKEGVIKRSQDGKGFMNVMLHTDFFRGNPDINLQPHKKNQFKDNVGHVIINDYLNTLAYNQILHGDSALSLKNDWGIDAVKRAKGDNAAIVPIRTDLTQPDLGITEPFTHSSVAIFKEPKGFSEHVQKQVDVADAQMYTTLKGLRYTLWGLGRLTPRLAKVLDALERGDDIHNMVGEDGKTYDAVFDASNGLLRWDEMTNSLKLVYKDGKTYFKMSVVVLQPNLTSLPIKNNNGQVTGWKPRPGWETLHNLRTSMETKNIQFAAPQSASKMMTMDVGKAGDFSDLKGHLYNNEFFGLQTANPSNKLEITTPTQLLQLIDTEQDDDVDVYYNGQTMTVKELRDQYQDYVSQKVTNAYEITKHEVYEIADFNKDVEESIAAGEVTPRLAKFQKRAVETLEASGSDAQLVEFFSLDENGNPRFNLNLSATKTKFAQLYLSYFSRGIMSQKNPGYTVALFSGIDTKVLKRAKRVIDGKVVEWDVVRRDQYDNNYGNVQNEEYLTDKAQVTKRGQLFLGELEYNVPEYNEQGEIVGYYSEMMLPPHFKDFLNVELSADKLPDAISKAFGVRIPSQDKHSFMSFRIVDFMPANLGSTGMFPKELIALSGADFDIDKEFISRYDFYVKKDARGNSTFHKYGDAVTPEERWEEYKMWMTKNNKSVKGIIKDLAKNDPEYQKLLEGNESVILDILGAKRTLIDNYYEGYTVQAFEQLGLPSSLDEFTRVSQTRELNNGTINNRIVDAFIALLTNKGMHDIAKTPATLTALEEIQDNDELFMKDAQGNKIGRSVFSKSNNFPVDSLAGKYHAFKNNTTGKNNIGIDVNANLIYSVLNKGKISITQPAGGVNDTTTSGPFDFDGQIFDTFDGNLEYNPVTQQFDGRRTNDVLSTLISSATDEAKEQLNALYGLTVDALKVVNYLVALKVPLKTAVYFVNQPAIRNYLDIKAVRQNTLQTKDEENLRRDDYKDAALERTANQIKDFSQLSDDEIVGMFEREGVLEVNCA